VYRIKQVCPTPFNETKICPLKPSLTKQRLIFILYKKKVHQVTLQQKLSYSIHHIVQHTNTIIYNKISGPIKFFDS
jgi:hypothetical protein